eukprot:CAMPEP_0174312810 /NCGR_PEP_ID=MMETSP0810-20121108/4536_1 /TAXON_ID=73025 ORGANISM="Eutreptiella gymnastica-like, Strain CCMP1594" /NCGR_SAMPLE_ID=MMETSP0810 /ASSEMBLY_ACC=CAM_ASM_000659 /LENGTH=54 /DNA_ID=CAMNT_0015421323 /DNA_START=776 /DNA_END=940 /DNA_ORIENTATION=+
MPGYRPWLYMPSEVGHVAGPASSTQIVEQVVGCPGPLFGVRVVGIDWAPHEPTV